MDISDISKIASRKRLNTDAEKLRDKVSRETAKIIKLKVAQDTAYWDLQEKLQQLQASHERLQQNMLDAQMQHEAASARLADELRLRPDALNKVCGVREICDALEQYGERVRRGVARCRADASALGVAYSAAGARAHDIAQDARAARTERDELVREMARLHEQLGAANARVDAMDEARRDITARLERCNLQLQQREEAVAAAQAQAARTGAALEAQGAELNHTREELHQLVQAEREAIRVRDERIAQLRAEVEAARDLLRTHREEADATISQLREELTLLQNHGRNMECVISERDQQVKQLEMEITRMRDQIVCVENQKRELEAEALKDSEEKQALKGRIVDLTQQVESLEGRLTELQIAYDTQRTADAQKIEELSSSVARGEAELDTKTNTITKLMGELKVEASARDAARRQHEADRGALEALNRDKDAELATQMRAIIDMRAEKERLQQRIATMQGTIDNIQKELTGRVPPAPATTRAERDQGPNADLLYGFLSDDSVESDALDPREVKRRFDALARGDPFPHKGIMPLSQVKKELQKKSRAFFKTKRIDNKSKKNTE